jgi:DNA-binding transcriptional MerR regulator
MTGFSASTIRFYEESGLVAPAGRSDNGYRYYDERDVGRLRFISRAKRLGLSLDDITGLVALFDLDECGPVQGRLLELLVAKQRDLAEQMAELESLSGQLAGVAERLGVPAAAGACHASCACFVEGGPAPASLPPAMPSGGGSDAEIPIACSLDADSMSERLEEWGRLASNITARDDTADGVRLRFGPGVSAAEVAELAAREQQCCSFLRFSVGIAGGEVSLDISAPVGARDVIDALLPVP